MNNTELMSLYDYLGRPAGQDLGKHVYLAAERKNIKVGLREISNPKYKGRVMLYPKSFLDEYFHPKPKAEGDSLPFIDDEYSTPF